MGVVAYLMSFQWDLPNIHLSFDPMNLVEQHEFDTHSQDDDLSFNQTNFELLNAEPHSPDDLEQAIRFHHTQEAELNAIKDAENA